MEEHTAPQPIQPAIATPPVPPIQSQPINPIKPAGKFSARVIIGIIIFLFLAGSAAASFTVFRPQIMSMISKPSPTPTIIQTLPTPTPDPTANWKTYTGDGFSIKYPETWTDLTSQNSNRALFTNNDNTNNISVSFDTVSSDSLCGLQCQNPSLADFLDVNNKTFWHLGNIGGGGPGTTYEQAGLVTVSAKNAVKQSNHVTTDFEQSRTSDITMIYYIPLPDFPSKIATISFNYNNSLPDSNKSIVLLDQILSTFKFIEPTLTPTVAQPVNLSPQDIGLIATLNSSRTNVIITIAKTELLSSLEYELDYDALVDGSYVPRGVNGSAQSIQTNSPFSRQVALGTCVNGICKYDKEVKNVRLQLSLNLTSGNKVPLQISIPTN